MKLLFGLLLILSIGMFSYMQWGGALTSTGKNVQGLGDLHPEKIKLIDALAAKQLVNAVVPAVQAPIAASAPAAVSLPASDPAPAVPVAAVAKALAPAPAPVPVQVHKSAAKVCMEWGEFSGTDLKRATQALDAMKLGDHLAQRSVEYTSGYWVYIPPLKNKKAVKNKIEELKKAGVEDYFVLQEKPRWTNTISLGVFKTEEAAKNYLASLKKKGVRAARIGERKSKLKFIVFQLKQIEAETGAQLLKLQKEYENSELNTVSCK